MIGYRIPFFLQNTLRYVSKPEPPVKLVHGMNVTDPHEGVCCSLRTTGLYYCPWIITSESYMKYT